MIIERFNIMANWKGFLEGFMKKEGVNFEKGLGTYVEQLNSSRKLILEGKPGLKLGETITCTVPETATIGVGNSQIHIKDLNPLFKNNNCLYVGRSTNNHVVLPNDPCVSRNHARVTKLNTYPPTYHVADLGSTNGTYVLKV